MNFSDTLVANFPIKYPYKFVDGISLLTEDSVEGYYTYKENEFFFEGHYPDQPITPGTILTETVTQIGLLSLGLFLLHTDNKDLNDYHFVLLSSNLKFRKIVLPNEKVVVKGYKNSYKRDLLRVRVVMLNDKEETVCKGELSGQIIKKQ